MTKKNDDPKFGPTGDFPRGRLGPHDDGGLRIGVATDEHGNVVVNFGTKVSWIAVPPEQAIQLGKLLMRHAGATRITVTIGDSNVER